VYNKYTAHSLQILDNSDDYDIGDANGTASTISTIDYNTSDRDRIGNGNGNGNTASANDHVSIGKIARYYDSNFSSDSYELSNDGYDFSAEDCCNMDDDSDIIHPSDECDISDLDINDFRSDYDSSECEDSSCDIEDCGCEIPVRLTIKIINTYGNYKNNSEALVISDSNSNSNDSNDSNDSTIDNSIGSENIRDDSHAYCQNNLRTNMLDWIGRGII